MIVFAYDDSDFTQVDTVQSAYPHTIKSSQVMSKANHVNCKVSTQQKFLNESKTSNRFPSIIKELEMHKDITCNIAVGTITNPPEAYV